MPLSAFGPDGPFHLVGVDAATLEQLKARNRAERLFVARCCGAPVQIRTRGGAVPHFVHISDAPRCPGGGKESPAHLALKAAIAQAALNAGWAVELEAEHRDARGELLWQADVLATRRTGRIAFEVQLSNPDWNDMLERQRRCDHHGIRGLWFLTSNRPYPQRRELPIFRVEGPPADRQVRVRGANDWPGAWQDVRDGVPLAEFVAAALGGRLRWAPARDDWQTRACKATVRMHGYGCCSRCGVTIGRPYVITCRFAEHPSHPVYYWHQGMRGGQRSYWVEPLLQLLQATHGARLRFAFADRHPSECPACGAMDKALLDDGGFPLLTCAVPLADLPTPRYGTVEWYWLHRWVLQLESQARCGGNR